MKSKERKWSSADVVTHLEKIKEIVKQQQKENELENFTVISEGELENKFSRINSPMIISQGWNHTNQGGVVNYNLGIYNPDPVNAIWVFAHVWVGTGNVVGNVGQFLLNIDTRFPRLTEPKFSGLNLAPGTSTILRFAMNIPDTVQETNYMGNSCLMGLNWHDVGTYYDRGVFIFNVS